MRSSLLGILLCTIGLSLAHNTGGDMFTRMIAILGMRKLLDLLGSYRGIMIYSQVISKQNIQQDTFH